MKETMWGIDLGGTKVEGIILRGDQEPETLIRTRVDTEAAQGYDHVIGQIEKLVRPDEGRIKTNTYLYRIRNTRYPGSRFTYFKKFQYHHFKSSALKKGSGRAFTIARYPRQ